MDALQRDDTDKVRHILSRHVQSVWTGKGESQAQWDLLRSALALVETCQGNDRLLADHARSMESLIDFYIAQFREVDHLHREFEQAVSDYDWQDTQGLMHPHYLMARSFENSGLENYLHYSSVCFFSISGY